MVTHRNPDALVLGAGVSGLTTAVCLAEAGLAVRVAAAQPPQATTSSMAGASWSPFMMNDDRMLSWSTASRTVLEEISLLSGSGVRMMNGMEADFVVAEPPEWATTVRDYRKCDNDELPAGYLSGWRYTIPIVDMPAYLTYLTGRLRAAGVEVEQLPAPVRRLPDVAGTATVVVNCAGLGARELVPDPALDPTRGQLVLVRNPGVDWFFLDAADDGDLTYFLPHGDQAVLGGSALKGRLDTVADPEIAAGILARCGAVEPRFQGAQVLRHMVALRPNRRGGVRVAAENVDGQCVVHNYGHGGSGVTVSWGSAATVLDLVRQAL
jgi:D-amino-acid oxidase